MSDEGLNVTIIGAGTKGALYPDERLTHAHAFSRNGFNLSVFCDPNEENLKKAKDRWGAVTCEHLSVALNCGSPVVTVAASDSAHYEILKEIGNHPYPPKLVFTEKPFCQNYAQAKEIADLYAEKGIELSVNFSRRFNPEFYTFKNIKMSVMTGYYTKGLHNLSHLVDLFLMMNVEHLQPIEVDRNDLNLFEAVLYGPSGKLSIEDHGARLRYVPTKPREDYPTDKILDYLLEFSQPVNLFAAMHHAAVNIRDHLTSGEPLLSTVENALRVMEVCEQWQN